MPDDDPIETVDAEPMLALETPLTGLPSALPAHLAAELAELLADAERYAAAAQTVNTTRAYASHWKQFQAWCDRYQLESLPASAPVIGLYVTSLAKRGVAVSPIRRRASAIARVHGSAPHKKKTALLRDPLLELIDRTDPTTTVGLRDRALLLLGFAVGLRRSELVALAIEHLSPPRTACGSGSRAPRPTNRAAARSSWSSTPSRLGPAPIGRSEPGLAPPRSPPALSFGA